MRTFESNDKCGIVAAKAVAHMNTLVEVQEGVLEGGEVRRGQEERNAMQKCSDPFAV